jgi:hypothetical protein
MSDDERACCILCLCCNCDSIAQRNGLTAIIQKAHPDLSYARAVAAANDVLLAHGHFKEVRKIVEAAVEAQKADRSTNG